MCACMHACMIAYVWFFNKSWNCWYSNEINKWALVMLLLSHPSVTYRLMSWCCYATSSPCTGVLAHCDGHKA